MLRYPRVLIVFSNCINKADQHNVSIRSWFGDWPKIYLAQIYSGGETGEEKYCAHAFKIGPNERRFGKIFFKIKTSTIGRNSTPVLIGQNQKALDRINIFSILINKVSEYLVNTGLWEVVFRPVLSPKLLRFIMDFRPDVIYCQGYSLSFTWLPVMIHNALHLPICFQTGDDWPSQLWEKSPFAFILRPIVDRSIKTLLRKASLRIANGKRMAEEYAFRYRMEFETLMMGDRLSRFQEAKPIRVVGKTIASIVFSGGLGHERWVSIIDLCQAAAILNDKGIPAMVTVFATGIPRKAVNALKEAKHLQLLPGCSHEELPSYLQGADILFLPETFDPDEVNKIKLSISTKAHLYMLSGKPTLIYAAPDTGIVRYSQDENWGLRVTERSVSELVGALNRLICEIPIVEKIARTGLDVAARNHDEIVVRSTMVKYLHQISNTNKSE